MREQQTARQQSFFRRLTALALSLIMVLTMLPATALAAEAASTSGQCGEDLTWEYNTSTKELTISGTGDMWAYDLSWDDPAPWFAYKDDIQTLIVNDGVISIGEDAFAECSSLTKVTLPSSLIAVYENAFSSCPNVAEVHIADLSAWCQINFGSSISIESYNNPLYSGAALYCNGQLVEDLVIPADIPSVRDAAFVNCSSLKSVTIPSNIETIHQYAFYGCHNLKQAALSEGPSIIEMGAFLSCSALEQLVIPDSVSRIETKAFSGCTSLERIDIGTGLKYLGQNQWGIHPSSDVFLNCSKLSRVNIHSTEQWFALDLHDAMSSPLSTGAALYCDGQLVENLIIPDGISELNNCLFANYAYLKSVTIPDSVTWIGHSCFNGCTNLTDIHLGSGLTEAGSHIFDGTAWLETQPDGPIYLEYGLFGYKGNAPSGELNIKPGVKFISNSAFADCTDLTSIVMPEGLETVGAYAFKSCRGIKKLSLPDSLLTIGRSTFENCTSLQRVSIPDKVRSIYMYTFARCTALKDISLGSGVYYIHQNAFEETAWYNAQSEGLLYLDGCLLGYKGNEPEGKMQVAAGTRVIATEAFSGCYHLTGVSLPEGLLCINSDSFSFSGLTSITVPDSVTHVDRDAFYGCSALRDIHMGKGATFIGRGAFTGTAWYDAQRDGLLYLNEYLLGYKGTAPTGVLEPKSGTRVIADNAFRRCTGLTSITFPKTLENIDTYAFYQCTGLEKIMFTENGHGCGAGAFEGVTATAYYPANDPTWTQEIRDDYPSSLTWVPYGDAPSQKLPAPTLKAANTASTGKPSLEWTAVDGAKKYEIFCATSKDGSYMLLDLTPGSATSYQHGSAVPGTTYYYQVRAVSSDAPGTFSDVVIRTCDLARPNVKPSTRSDGKPVLTWAAVPGAQKYLVYCRVDGGAFERLTTVSGTRLTHGSAQPGHTYTYKVRALASKSAANSAWSYYDTITVEGLSTPTLTVTNTASTGKPYLKWTAVSSADKYEVYYSTSKSNPYQLLYRPSGTTLKHGSAKAGTTYYYKVRAITNEGVKGEFSPYKLRTCDLGRPDVKLYTRNGHPYLDWKSISGAVKYDVYCSVDGGSFTRLIGVKSSHLTHSSARKGHTYRYRVKAIASKSSANSAWSYYDTITVK